MWQIIPPGWTLVLLCLRLGNAQETLLWWLLVHITGLYWGHSLIFNTLLNILRNRKKNVPQREVLYYTRWDMGRWYIIVKYVTKTATAKSEEILEISLSAAPPVSSVFVRIFNPVLLVVWGWGRRGGAAVNTFFDVFQRWKKLLWQPKLYCKFFLSYSLSLSALWLLNYSLC